MGRKGKDFTLAFASLSLLFRKKELDVNDYVKAFRLFFSTLQEKNYAAVEVSVFFMIFLLP